jgi:hypothetical protein
MLYLYLLNTICPWRSLRNGYLRYFPVTLTLRHKSRINTVYATLLQVPEIQMLRTFISFKLYVGFCLTMNHSFVGVANFDATRGFLLMVMIS